MADRYEWFDVTIPANTPANAPVTFPMVFADGEVTQITAKILDGPSGLVGFNIQAGGSQYVPRTAGSFIRPNDDYFVWPVANAINSGSWGLAGFNTDIWDHAIQVGFQINDRGLSLSTAQEKIGTSSATLIAAGTSSPPSSVPLQDPLSPDSILASVNPDIMAFLASQQAPSPEIASLTSAGTP